MKKKGILKRALLLALVIITVLSCAAVAFSAGWNGDGATGGSASSTASGAYAILRGGTAESMIVGFRFSGRLGENVKEKPDEDIQSIDVILKEEEYNISLLGKMSPQYSKADYFQIACKSDNEIETGNIVYMQSDAIWGDNDYTYMESELDFNTRLPHDSSDLAGALKSWQDDDLNLDVIATLLGWNGLAGMGFNDRIYIEPLYGVKIRGEDLMLTSTEIAWYGAMLYGWDFNGKNNGATNPNDYKDPNYWAFIGSNYTHRRVPNALYAPEQAGSLGWTLATGIAADDGAYNLTSYDILTGSWGVGICYIKETNVPDIVVSNFQAALSDGTVLDSYAVPKDEYVYIWCTVTNNSTQKQKINLYRYTGSSSCLPTNDTNHAKYYPATTCTGVLKESWTPTFSSSTTTTPLFIWIMPGKTVRVRVASMKFTSNTYVHFATWLEGERYSTTTTGAENGCDELSKSNNYKYGLIQPVDYQPNVTMTNVKLCSDEKGNTEYPKDANGVYQIPQGDTAYVFMRWKNTGNCRVRYDVHDIVQGGSFASPARTGAFGPNIEVVWLLCNSFTAQSTNTVTREAHVYLQGKTSAANETITTDNVIAYKYKSIPQEVTVTINHYLMNTDGSTYTYKESSYATIKSETTITAANYKKSYSGFSYSFAQVDSNTVTTAYIDRAKTINLYYTRNKYTVTLNNGTGISGTSGSGSYYHGVTVKIDATVKTGYHWNNWTGTYTLATKSTSFAMPTSNVTLTANAIANTYTIVYNGNGNTGGSTASSTHTYDVAKNLTANGYTKTGYYFVGWNTAANGSGTSYTDKQSVINLTAVNGGTVTLYAQWKPYTLTINYYSNYATNSFSNPLNAVGSNKNVVVRQYVVKYDDPMPDGLHDYSYSTAGTYLYRNRWCSNGHWNTKTDGSGISVDQGTGFAYAQDLAYTLGVPISDKHQTINVYPEWTPHYDVELTDIFFKAYDSNGNLYTLNSTQQMNIPIGTKVYVYYTYKNRSPVEVNITGYNTSGSAISYNGSTNYNIPGWDATLTVTAGSFVATPLGPANISGSVYINGIAVSNESTDIDDNAKTNNTRTENYYVKFDVEIVDIYFTDYEGNLIDMNAGIPVNSEVVIHHIYRNNSSIDITVNGYDNAGNKITYNGTQKFTIPAYGTIDIIAGEMRTPSEPGIYSIGGAVYRDGKTAATEKDEWDLNNNVIGTINGVNGAKDKHYTTEIGPYLTPIAPNAAYREGTDVITSFYVYNPTANNYTPDSPILVRIKIYDTYSGNLITEMTQTTVCPANAILTPENGGDPNSMAQIVYFKWHVPYLENYNDIKIVADLDLPEYSYWWGRVSRNYDYGIWGINYTPDTSYEDKQPAGWTKPGSVADAKGNASWGVWEHINGEFVYQTYGIEATGGKLILTPQSKTAYEENHMWYMKAGYGFTAEATTAKIGKFGGTTSKKPGTDAYTGAQYAYMYYPEFQYQIGSNTIDTMENVDGKWQLFEFLDYGRVHFTPIWYPDGVYDAVMVQSDIWTPKGMIITQEVSSIIIEGDMYDDWYVQGQG